METVRNTIVAATALIAITLTLVTIYLQRRNNRDQTFLRLHEILMDDEMRIGRAALIEVGKTGVMPAFESAEYRQMTHAIGGLETARIYLQLKLMSRRRFILVWHHNLRAMHAGAERMARHRVDALEGWWPWPNLWPLFDAAATFHNGKMLCCQQPGRWPSGRPSSLQPDLMAPATTSGESHEQSG